MAVLERGGNAFDAAVAAGFALQVVEPHLNGPGGEVPVIGHDARRGETFVVCGQGTGARPRRPRAPTPISASTWCPAAGCSPPTCRARSAPGCCCCASTARCALRDVLELRDRLRRATATRCCPRRPRRSPRWPACSASTGTPPPRPTCREAACPPPGSRFANRRWPPPTSGCVDEAEAAADDREARSRRPARPGTTASSPRRSTRFAGHRGHGHHRRAAPRPAHRRTTWPPGTRRLEAPATYDYRGCTVCKTGPWGQGPVFLQQLALLAGYDLAGMRPGSAEFVHTVDRGGQARLRRPRGLVRRPRVHATSRWPSCCRRPTTTSAARSSARPSAWTCGPAAPPGGSRSCLASPRARPPPRFRR